LLPDPRCNGFFCSPVFGTNFLPAGLGQTKKQKKQSTVAFKLTKFAMGNTLLTFVDEHSECGGGGSESMEERGPQGPVTIGGCDESAWLTDLVEWHHMSWATKKHFKNAMCKGTHRDDGPATLRGNRKWSDVIAWMKDFQASVNNLAESECLQFAAEIWGSDENDAHEVAPEVTANKKGRFACLDIELCWEGDDLRFRVNLGQNQQLKHLGEGRMHTI